MLPAADACNDVDSSGAGAVSPVAEAALLAVVEPFAGVAAMRPVDGFETCLSPGPGFGASDTVIHPRLGCERGE